MDVSGWIFDSDRWKLEHAGTIVTLVTRISHECIASPHDHAIWEVLEVAKQILIEGFCPEGNPLCMCTHASYPENSGLTANSRTSHELRRLRRQEKHARRAESESNTSVQVCMQLS